MNAAVRAYLDAVRASVITRKDVKVARLLTLRAGATPIGEVTPELDALLNGLALDLPRPDAPDEIAAWQNEVRDWLLRATVAPVGDLGWITVVDEQRQHVRFHAAPQLRAQAGALPVPPPIDVARLTALAAGETPDAVLQLAPASFSEDAITALATALAPRGRKAGALLLAIVEAAAWWTPPPPPTAADFFAIQIETGTLRISPGRGSGPFTPIEVPTNRLFEIYPAATPDGEVWLRVWGCFDDHATVDVGPLPGPIAGEVAQKLRRQLGLPRPIDPMMSTRALIGRDVQQWVEVLGTWTPGPLADAPDFDGLRLHLPPGGLVPRRGSRLKVRGLFQGPSTLRAIQWEPA